MSREIFVQARPDHISDMARSTPLSALEELVWNALDADAREVKIDIIESPLGGIDSIRVSDDGTGIDVSNMDETFGSLGGSWKRSQAFTASGTRRLHGAKGCGRFKAFALGEHVEWRTTVWRGDRLESAIISGSASRPGVFEVSGAAPGPGAGTEVFITDIRAAAIPLNDAESTIQALAAKLAIYLKSYPQARVYFSGIPVTPVIMQKSSTVYPIRLEDGSSVTLEVIDWRRKFPGAGRIVFASRDGFALHETSSGIRAGADWSFTAYLVADRFAALAEENSLVMEELNPEVAAYLAAARSTLKTHFQVLAAQQDHERVRRWVSEGIYPFAIDDASERRRAFDEAVGEMRGKIDAFDSLPSPAKAYIFSLILKATP